MDTKMEALSKAQEYQRKQEEKGYFCDIISTKNDYGVRCFKAKTTSGDHCMFEYVREK